MNQLLLPHPPQAGDKTLTYDAAMALLRRAVEEKGADYVYPRANTDAGCVNYEEDGTPSCIVGHVLHYLGATGHQALSGARWSLPDAGIVCEHRALNALATAQVAQDTGTPWGRAVELAEERA